MYGRHFEITGKYIYQSAIRSSKFLAEMFHQVSVALTVVAIFPFMIKQRIANSGWFNWRKPRTRDLWSLTNASPQWLPCLPRLDVVASCADLLLSLLRADCAWQQMAPIGPLTRKAFAKTSQPNEGRSCSSGGIGDIFFGYLVNADNLFALGSIHFMRR